jgi:hypothetical protein
MISALSLSYLPSLRGQTVLPTGAGIIYLGRVSKVPETATKHFSKHRHGLPSPLGEHILQSKSNHAIDYFNDPAPSHHVQSLRRGGPNLIETTVTKAETTLQAKTTKATDILMLSENATGSHTIPKIAHFIITDRGLKLSPNSSLLATRHIVSIGFYVLSM